MTEPNGGAEEQIIDYPGVQEASAPPPPLSQRLRDPRTIISIVLPIALVVLIAITFSSIDFQALIDSITHANPWFLLLGLRRVLPRLPAAWLPLAAVAARCRHAR